MSAHNTFVVANGDDLDIIKDWIQDYLDKNTGTTFKAIKVFVIDRKDEENMFEFESEVDINE